MSITQNINRITQSGDYNQKVTQYDNKGWAVIDDWKEILVSKMNFYTIEPYNHQIGL